MSTPFDRPLYGYRFVVTGYGDTLQKIAARYLGDAGRWVEIIVLNGMQPPYLTDDPAAVGPGVLLNGGYITIPAAAPGAQTNDPDTVFRQDIALVNGNLTFTHGDMDVVSGLANLDQALNNLLATDCGELMYHTGYGTHIRRMIGAMNGPTATLIAAEYAKSAIAADPRIAGVTRATGTAVGDTVSVVVKAETIQGTTATTSKAF